MGETQNPAPASFPYGSLEEGSIRLVTLLPRQDPADIKCVLGVRHSVSPGDGSDHRFKALSYCWDDPTLTRPITVNGLAFSVTINLWNALSAIIQHHDISQPFWIDAICINQTDVNERNHQVKHMWHIFSQAEHVYAWLGMPDEETNLAYATMERLAKGCRANIAQDGQCGKARKKHKPTPQQANKAVYGLCRREYFNRVWTIVEMTNAREMSILCGTYITDLKILLHATESALSDGKAMTKVDIRTYKISDSRRWNRGSKATEVTKQPKIFQIHTFFDILAVSHCSNPRDRVFAMISITPIRDLNAPLDMLGPDYRWTDDEVVLVLLEFWTHLHDLQSEGPAKFRQYIGTLRYLISRAFGVPETPGMFLAWFQGHEEWMQTWQKDKTVVPSTGRIVTCSGLLWDALLLRKTVCFPDRSIRTPTFSVATVDIRQRDWVSRVMASARQETL